MQQLSKELGKSNRQKCLASIDNGGVRIKSFNILQRLATSMNKVRQNHWTTLVQDLQATKDKLEWLPEMDSALGAVSHMACVLRQAVRTQYCRCQENLRRYC